VGSTPPNPRPARKRRPAKTSGLGAKAQSRFRTENPVTVSSIVFRRPMVSLTVPITSAPTITPTSPVTEIREAEFGSSPQSPYVSSVGRTTPRTTRSKPSRATAAQQSGVTQAW
jgi:hypothetical protein